MAMPTRRRKVNRDNADCKDNPVIVEINNRLSNHETRITELEGLAVLLANIDETVTKVLKYIKIGAPSIVAAAVSAGILNGKLGAFLNALVTGVPL